MKRQQQKFRMYFLVIIKYKFQTLKSQRKIFKQLNLASSNLLRIQMTALNQNITIGQIQTNQSQQQTIQSSLLAIYQERLQSFFEVTKIYQQTLQKDSQQGALAFMKTQDMKNYRVQRQLELLKDALLIQKQKVIIQVLTNYHQLKNDHQTFLKQHTKIQKQIQNIKLQQNQNIPQKDNLFKNQPERSQKLKNPSNLFAQKSIDSKNLYGLSSNDLKINTSLSLYEKMLQQKMVLLKEMQKKNKLLKTQNQQKSQKINSLEQKIKQAIIGQQKLKQCQKCVEKQKEINKLDTQNRDLMIEIQEIKKSHSEKVEKLKQLQKQIIQNKLKITQSQGQIQNIKKQSQTPNIKQIPQYRSHKPSPHANIQMIKQLKQKLFLQQQQLMTLTNSFQFLKQDLNQSLLNEVKKLRASHKTLKDQIKTYINNFKSEMVTFVTQIVATVQIKPSGKRSNTQIFKSLRKLDNQLDFFIEQNDIKD